MLLNPVIVKKIILNVSNLHAIFFYIYYLLKYSFMKNSFFILVFLLILNSCKTKELPVIFSKYDESSEIKAQQNHGITRMRYKLIQSNFLDMNKVYKPLER